MNHKERVDHLKAMAAWGLSDIAAFRLAMMHLSPEHEDKIAALCDLATLGLGVLHSALERLGSFEAVSLFHEAQQAAEARRPKS